MSYSICVFCASSDNTSPRYFEQARELGEEIARRGHRLVYGGGRVGLMGTVVEIYHVAATVHDALHQIESLAALPLPAEPVAPKEEMESTVGPNEG